MPINPACEALLAAAAPPDISIADFRAREPAFTGALKPFRQDVGAVEDRRVGGPGGEAPIRIYRPRTAGPRPILLLIHGGGWVVGSIETHDVQARDLCVALEAIVVSVDYRRAPEHPFPAAFDDSWAALVWAFDHARALGGDARRLIVAGDSAGGNIAAALAIRARDQGAPPLAAQLLIHPVLDLSEPYYPTPSRRYPSRLHNGEGYGATSFQLETYGRMYLGSEGRADDPRISPMRAQVAGVAPAVIVIAQYDPLHDEGAAYADKLAAAEVPVDLIRFEGAIHGAFGPALAGGFLSEVFETTMARLRRLTGSPANSL